MILPNSTKRARRRVAIVYPLSIPWMTTFVHGMLDYAQKHGGWALTTSPPSLPRAGEHTLTIANLEGWPGDGAVVVILNQADIRAARRLGIPVVNIAATLRDTGLPRVIPDHYDMGRVAAEHFLERGLRRLAYFGLQGYWFSKERRRGFVECAEQAGATCDVLEVPRDLGNWKEKTGLLVRWLRRLRPPVGLLAVQDYRARVVIEECERLGLRIPHDVAVMGMENDPTLCEFCHPTLSSVSRNPWRSGVETATMLDRLMDGLPTPTDVVLPSDGVVARQSTDTIAVEDPHLTAALHFIHDHLNRPFGISQVVRAASISRRQLETRFCRMLNCTPLDYLSRKRIERAKRMLLSPDKIKFPKVATACGFSNVEQMRHTFKRVIGMTPFEFRQAELKKSGKKRATAIPGEKPV